MGMRIALMMTAMAAVAGCGGGASNNASGNGANAAAANKAANAAAPAASNQAAASANSAATAPAGAASASLPPDFPETDPVARAASCYVFLGISRATPSQATGYDDVAMRQSQDQWRSFLRQTLNEIETDQLLGSSVNPLIGTPAAQRDAASRWCVQNAVEVDPEG